MRRSSQHCTSLLLEQIAALQLMDFHEASKSYPGDDVYRAMQELQAQKSLTSELCT